MIGTCSVTPTPTTVTTPTTAVTPTVNTNAGDTTYLSDLVRWESSEDQEKIAILIYYSDAVEGIGPSGYMKSNGFHAFHFSGEIKQRSLLAVFER